jgi:hypothetical protein
MIINGQEYAWADLEVVMSGKTTPLQGILEIEYSTQQEHNHLHAKGRDPHSMTSGNKMYNGKLVVLQSEVEAMQRAFGAGRDVTDSRGAVVTIAYMPDSVGQITVDQIVELRFEEIRKGMRSGDGHMTVELPFKALKINYNV